MAIHKSCDIINDMAFQEKATFLRHVSGGEGPDISRLTKYCWRF